MVQWLPESRVKQLTMTKRWLSAFRKEEEKWGVPIADQVELSACFDKASATLQYVRSVARSPEVTAQCQRVFDILQEKLLYIKEHYITNAPATEEELNALFSTDPDPLPPKAEASPFENGNASLGEKDGFSEQERSFLVRLSHWANNVFYKGGNHGRLGPRVPSKSDQHVAPVD
ncbi:MAG: hypothetical protein LBB43_01515 [Spirochaetaceae bacterium]|jgi:hypothetical protein|nr:hypothetical protein [Spirochaetaceae bacterium]